MSVILETSLGDITLDLYTEERPRCCVNFLKLCKIKYYNFCLFHSVQAGLVAQTGDPTGTGKGGESIFGKLYGDQAKYFEWEVKPKMKHRKLGSLSMVNNGDNLHGSQFFITLGENIDYLDNVHTVFGEVAEGFEVLEKLNEAYVDKDSIPYRDIRIFHTIVLEDPLDDPTGLGEFIPDRSPEPTREQLDSGRIGVDEDIDKTKDMTREQVQELLEGKEAKANAQILTMIGDLPTEDIEAPDNVLFVCKLNPVTSEEDLEIIFSRFGPILNCEVIKDHKTEDSLQYAFIEFKDPKHCENAYFKMDNVLIDDRRIHVDFSQSVSKIKWKGKGKGVEIEQKEQKEPGYKIIDPSSRDIGNYDYVFDEGDAGSSKQHKKKKKKHKREQELPSRDDDHRRKHGSKHERHRSRSSSPKTRGNKSDKRSRREDERSSDRYSREDTRHRDRGSYKDREKYRDSRR